MGLLEDFVEHNTNDTFSIVSLCQLDALRSEGVTAEQLIMYLASKTKALLKGSQRYVSGVYMPYDYKRRIIAVDNARVAMLRAIVRTETTPPELEQMFSSGMPEKVCLAHTGKKGVGKQGFVYLLRPDSSFFNFPSRTCQHVSYAPRVQILAKVEISRQDLPYHIADHNGEILG